MHLYFHVQTNQFLEPHSLSLLGDSSVHGPNMGLNLPFSQPKSKGGQATPGNGECEVRDRAPFQ